MKEYRATLIERIKRTPSIESFRFRVDRDLAFQPGQFLQVICDEKNRDNRILNKYLSFSSSPTREYIEVTKRLSKSEFSQHLNGLSPKDSLLIKAPMGNCVLRDGDKALTFLVGGIGITPVISIIEYVLEKNIPIDIEVYYSNRKDDDIAFRKELDQWVTLHNNVRVLYLVTECPTTDRSCIFGQIDKNLVCKESKCLGDRVFFVFGPPKMVEAMKGVCDELGCSKNNVRTESFIGY